MSYTGRKKYKSRKEKAETYNRNIRAIAWGILLFGLGLLYYKRIDIIDYIGSFFR